MAMVLVACHQYCWPSEDVGTTQWAGDMYMGACTMAPGPAVYVPATHYRRADLGSTPSTWSMRGSMLTCAATSPAGGIPTSTCYSTTY